MFKSPSFFHHRRRVEPQAEKCGERGPRETEGLKSVHFVAGGQQTEEEVYAVALALQIVVPLPVPVALKVSLK